MPEISIAGLPLAMEANLDDRIPATQGDVVGTSPTASITPEMILALYTPTPPPKRLVLQLSGMDFTPVATGNDTGGIVMVPFDPLDGTSTIAWNVTRIDVVLLTAGTTTTSLKVARSTSDPFTEANYVNDTTVDLVSGAYRNDTTTPNHPTLNSGDLICCDWTALGTGAAGFAVYVSMEAA